MTEGFVVALRRYRKVQHRWVVTKDAAASTNHSTQSPSKIPYKARPKQHPDQREKSALERLITTKEVKWT
jgi:hypothetical protein